MKVSIGLTFLTRAYTLVNIVRYSSHEEFPFVGDNGEYYDVDGFALGDSSNDLLVPNNESNM